MQAFDLVYFQRASALTERDPFLTERDPFLTERDPFLTERDPLSKLYPRNPEAESPL
jgi:hypothetical protein